MHTESLMVEADTYANPRAMALVHPANPDVSNWRLAQGVHTAGREPDCDIVIDDCTVSRHHACLYVNDGGPVRLIDLGSRNGTWINNHRVEGEAVLQPGDRVTFGVVTLMLQSAAQILPVARSLRDPADAKKSTQDILDIVPIAEALARTTWPDFAVAKAYKALCAMPEDSFHSLEELCQHALKRLGRVIKGERYALFLARGAQGSVERIAGHQVSASMSPASFRSESIFREVMVKRRAVHFRARTSGGRQFTGTKAMTLQKCRTALAVPLIHHGQVLGVLYADTTQRKQRYAVDALKLMAACAHAIAPKIANFRA